MTTTKSQAGPVGVALFGAASFLLGACFAITMTPGAKQSPTCVEFNTHGWICRDCGLDPYQAGVVPGVPPGEAK